MTTVTEAVTEINNAQPIAESQERDCMQCEKTFTTTNAENADLCPSCRPKPAAPRKWQTQAGPIQSKKVQKAIQSISWEGRTYSEIEGVIGGEQSTHSFTMIYGGMREDASAALTALAEKFNYMVTRENYQAIIDECAAVVAQLAKTRPVTDKRVTPEAAAETARKNVEFRVKQDAIAAERRAAQAAIDAERKAQEEAARAAAPVVTGCATVRYNREHDGVEIEFPAKPTKSVIDSCKFYGFRWSMRSKLWYHKFSATAWKNACRIAGIDELPHPKAGCDRCGTNDRANGLPICEECAAENPDAAYVQAQEDAFQDAECARIGA